MSDVFQEINTRTGEAYPRWRGMVSRCDRREKVVLFTDKKLSQRHLQKLQAEADEQTHDPVASARRRQESRPIGEHVSDYVAFLVRTTKSLEHQRISESLLRRLVALAGWCRLSDISQASVERVVSDLVLVDGREPTAQYRNQFIKRAKAFAAWCVPDRLPVNPLLKLRRCSAVRGLSRRNRRQASADELHAICGGLPPRKQLALGLTCLAGLRRSEATSLTWDDVRLNAPIPFIQCRAEWVKVEGNPCIPLHPELVRLMRQVGPGDASARVIPCMPDVKTLKRRLDRAGFAFIVNGRRLDQHALRHTFTTNLSQAGCTRAELKALRRDRSGDVTDGYDHATLAGTYAAVCKLASPFVSPEPAMVPVAATGTESRAYAEQTGCFSVQLRASRCTIGSEGVSGESAVQNAANHGKIMDFQPDQAAQLRALATADRVSLSGPSTQVD